MFVRLVCLMFLTALAACAPAQNTPLSKYPARIVSVETKFGENVELYVSSLKEDYARSLGLKRVRIPDAADSSESLYDDLEAGNAEFDRVVNSADTLEWVQESLLFAFMDDFSAVGAAFSGTGPDAIMQVNIRVIGTNLNALQSSKVGVSTGQEAGQTALSFLPVYGSRVTHGLVADVTLADATTGEQIWGPRVGKGWVRSGQILPGSRSLDVMRGRVAGKVLQDAASGADK